MKIPPAPMRRPAYYDEMAAYKPLAHRAWHLEQWYPLSGMWAGAEREHLRFVGHDFVKAMKIAECAPADFRVVFREEKTFLQAGEFVTVWVEQVMGLGGKPSVITAPVLPCGGPYLIEQAPIAPRSKKAQRRHTSARITQAQKPSHGAMADAFARADFVGPQQKINGMYADGSCYIAP